MLLNRERVKFWQKIIFGAMAALMAGFLIFGYSGVASSCNGSNSLKTGNSALDKRLKQAQETLKTNPKDATALLQLAQGYQAVGYGDADPAKQASDLSQAVAYYDRYIKLPNATLGATANDLRYSALQAKGAIFVKLLDYSDAAKTYQAMIKLRPKDAQPVLALGVAQAQAGKTAAAITTFKQYLKLQPQSATATQVKQYIAQLEASTASPSPSPSST